MKNKEYISFTKMIEYVDKAIEYTKGYNFEKFSEDNKTIDATVFSISQIGELVKNISKETMEKYSHIEWNMIKGLRNRIVHDYEGINLKSIWYILENDIIKLKEDIQKIISIEKIQEEFEGEAERLGLKTEEDVVKLIKEYRKENNKS